MQTKPKKSTCYKNRCTSVFTAQPQKMKERNLAKGTYFSLTTTLWHVPYNQLSIVLWNKYKTLQVCYIAKKIVIFLKCQ